MSENPRPGQDGLVLELARLASARFGLRLSKDRLGELARVLRTEDVTQGQADPGQMARLLIDSERGRETLDILAAHLTVGETFFYREPLVFAQLEKTFLPALVKRAWGRGQGVKILSAGCATGEEAYSAAIALHRTTLGHPPPESKIIGADINTAALEAARRGQYREWSFRGLSPGIKEQYFRKTGKGSYVVSPRLAEMIVFHRLNLAGRDYANQVPGLVGLDLIFCRNVLMYFNPQAVALVVNRLIEALSPGGFLILNPSEAMFARGAPLELAGTGGVAIYRKPEKELQAGRQTGDRPMPALATRQRPAPTPAAHPAEDQKSRIDTLGAQAEFSGASPLLADEEALYRQAQDLYHDGRYEQAAGFLEDWLKANAHAREEPGLYAREITLLARILANLDRTAEAVEWSQTLVQGDGLNPAAHFALGAAYREAGLTREARDAFTRALYLDSGFVAAELALAGLCRDSGENARASKHYANVAAMLAQAPAQAVVEESGGLTAAAVRQFALSLMDA